MKKILILFLVFLVFISGTFFYFRHKVYKSLGKNQGQNIEILKGQGASEIGEYLEEKGIILNDIYFNYFVFVNDISDKILPGNYFVSSGMTIPEIAQLITEEKSRDIKVTFPEGWTIKQMAERLDEKGLPGRDFLDFSENSEKFEFDYEFLKNRKNNSLEGYLFPDTYFFLPESSAEKIIRKMLDNFDLKITQSIKKEIAKRNKTLEEIVIMASIIEKEVSEEDDRKIVSGIFWNRIKINQALQSCATVSYVLGENKKQFSYEETRIDSPFNTYINTGLPPGAINNPGISSILAAILPQNSNYNYFLNDPETGETVFSRTVDEHNINKKRVGL